MQKLLTQLKAVSNKKNQEHLLQLILIELQYLLLKIQLCSNIIETNQLFDLLETTQLSLVTLNNSKHIQLPSLLLQFTVDFNNVYDQNNRQYFFENIKKNRYVYGDIIDAFSKILNDFKQGCLKPQLVENQENLITKSIQNLLYFIAAANTAADADIFFEKLLTIQELLSKMTFVYNIPLHKPLMNFIYDCERLDDAQTRVNLFKRIKQGEYNIFR